MNPTIQNAWVINGISNYTSVLKENEQLSKILRNKICSPIIHVS